MWKWEQEWKLKFGIMIKTPKMTFQELLVTSLIPLYDDDDDDDGGGDDDDDDDDDDEMMMMMMIDDVILFLDLI